MSVIPEIDLPGFGARMPAVGSAGRELGAHDVVVGELEAHVQLQPLREDLNDRPRERLEFRKPIEEIGALLLR